MMAVVTMVTVALNGLAAAWQLRPHLPSFTHDSPPSTRARDVCVVRRVSSTCPTFDLRPLSPLHSHCTSSARRVVCLSRRLIVGLLSVHFKACGRRRMKTRVFVLLYFVSDPQIVWAVCGFTGELVEHRLNQLVRFELIRSSRIFRCGQQFSFRLSPLTASEIWDLLFFCYY